MFTLIKMSVSLCIILGLTFFFITVEFSGKPLAKHGLESIETASRKLETFHPIDSAKTAFSKIPIGFSLPKVSKSDEPKEISFKNLQVKEVLDQKKHSDEILITVEDKKTLNSIIAKNQKQ